MDPEVTIPDEIRQMYIERRFKDIESLKLSLANRKLEEFKRIGHQLKGNAASFGHHDLEKIAVNLEAAAEKQDFTDAQRQLHLFEQWLSRQRPVQ